MGMDDVHGPVQRHPREAVRLRNREDGVISNQQVDVGVISCHEVMTRGLLSMLAEVGPEVTGRACTWQEARGADAVLYDVFGLSDPEQGDAAALRRLVEETDTVIVAVDRPLRADLVAGALELGATAYLTMDADPEEVRAVIRDAVAGTYGTDAASSLVERASAEERLGRDVGLTPAEVVTLRLIAKGLSNEEIARELYLSVNTIKTRIRSTYRRLGVQHRSQAVAWAIRHGLGHDE